MAVVEQGRGIAVVRDEGAAVGGGGGDQGQEGVEIAGGRALADHHDQAAAQLLARLLQPSRFVVGADAGGGVGVERGPAEAGRVAVDRQAAGAGRGELRQHVGVGGEDAGEVHHLAEAGDTGAVERGGDGGRVEDRAARLARRGRDARRHGEEGAQRQIARRRDQRVHAGQAEDVGDLVRVGNDRAGAVRHGDAGELADPELRAFEVDVRVDEGRGEEAPLQVDRLPRVREPAGIGVEPGDPPARHRDRRRLDLAAEDVDDLPAAQHQVGRPPPLRDLDQLAHRRRVHRCPPTYSRCVSLDDVRVRSLASRVSTLAPLQFDFVLPKLPSDILSLQQIGSPLGYPSRALPSSGRVEGEARSGCTQRPARVPAGVSTHARLWREVGGRAPTGVALLQQIGSPRTAPPAHRFPFQCPTVGREDQ